MMLKSTLSESIFIRLAVVGSENYECKIPTEYGLIEGQGHQRSSILVPIESARATSYQSLIVTLDVSPTVFEIIGSKRIGGT